MKQRQKFNKKGAVTDIFLFLILTFIIGIICVILYMISHITEDELLSHAPSVQSGLSTDNNFTEVVGDTYSAVPRSFEALKWITVMIIVGMALGTILTGYLVRVHKAFFVIYILIVLMAIIFSVPLSNTYEELSQNPTLEPYFSGFIAQNYIFENLPIWVTVVGIISGVIMFISIIKAPGDEYY